MSELNSMEIIAKITAIDADIATLTDSLGTAGSTSANLLKYKIGNKDVDGTGRLTQLLASREMYQKLLNQIPSVIIRNADYSVEPGTARDRTDYIGDQ